jgi:hypothetical protein
MLLISYSVFYLARFSSLGRCFQARPESTFKSLKGAPLLCRLLALSTNVRLGWKGLAGANSLAY